MNALKNLGLNVVKANVYLDSSGKHNKFSITKAYILLPLFVSHLSSCSIDYLLYILPLPTCIRERIIACCLSFSCMHVLYLYVSMSIFSFTDLAGIMSLLSYKEVCYLYALLLNENL